MVHFYTLPSTIINGKIMALVVVMVTTGVNAHGGFYIRFKTVPQQLGGTNVLSMDNRL